MASHTLKRFRTTAPPPRRTDKARTEFGSLSCVPIAMDYSADNAVTTTFVSKVYDTPRSTCSKDVSPCLKDPRKCYVPGNTTRSCFPLPIEGPFFIPGEPAAISFNAISQTLEYKSDVSISYVGNSCHWLWTCICHQVSIPGINLAVPFFVWKHGGHVVSYESDTGLCHAKFKVPLARYSGQTLHTHKIRMHFIT